MARIVEATAVSCGRADKVRTDYARAMEALMREVVARAYDEGLGGDPDEIKKRMAIARTCFKERFSPTRRGNP